MLRRCGQVLGRAGAGLRLPAALVAGLWVVSAFSLQAAEVRAPQILAKNSDDSAKDLGWFWIRRRDTAPGPFGNEIRGLLTGPSGDLWIITNQGLNRLHNGVFRLIGRRQGLPHEQTVDIAATDAGVVIATPGGLSWIDELASPERGADLLWSGPVGSVAVHDGAVWFVVRDSKGRKKLFRRALDSEGRPVGWEEGPETMERFGVRTTSMGVDRRIRRIFPALPGSLFGLDAAANVLRYATPDGKRFKYNPMTTNEAFLGTLSAENQAWLLTSKRLLVFEVGSAEPMALHGVEGAQLLASSREGRAWLERFGELWQIDIDRREIVAMFRLPEGPRPQALAEDLAGRIWLGTVRGLFMAEPRNRVFTRPADSGFAETRVIQTIGMIHRRVSDAAGFDAAGRVWLGENGRILFPEAAEYDCSEVSLEGLVLDAFIGRQAWVMTTAGLSRIEECDPIRLELGADLLKSESVEPVRKSRILTTLDDDVMLQIELGSRVESSALLHIGPHGSIFDLPNSITMNQISDGTLDLVSKGLMMLDDNQDILIFNEKLEAQRVRGPAAVRKATLHHAAAPKRVGHPVLATERTLWRWTAGTSYWVREADLQGESNLLGILPDLRTGGALIGCSYCPQSNLYSTLADGTVAPLAAFTDAWVGGGNNAMLRDSRNLVWISALAGLYVQKGNDARPVVVRDARGDVLNPYMNSLIEFPENSGKIWGAAARQPGVWLLEDGQPPRRVLETVGIGVTLLAKDGKIWAGGDGFLKVLDPETGDPIADRWADIVRNVSPGTWILGLAADRDAVLALTSVGMYRITSDEAREVSVEGGWPSITDADCCEMRVSKNGSIAVFANSSSGTQFWMRPPEGENFNKIAETSFKADSMAIDADGNFLVGASNGTVYLFKEGQFIPRWTILNQSGILMGSSFAGVCPLGPTRILALGKSPHPVLIDSNGNNSTLAVNLTSWKDCAPLSDSRVLLLHTAWVNLLDLSQLQLERIEFQPPDAQPTTFHQMAQMVQAKGIVPDFAWLLGDRFIWIYSPGETVFRRLVELPPRVQVAFSGLRMVVDQDGIWLAPPRSGLWRWSGDPLTRSEGDGDVLDWKVWDVSDGLPSSTVLALFPWKRGETVIFTSGGMVLGHRRGADDWVFKPIRQDGMLGHQVQVGAMFRLVDGSGGRKVVAIGTESGLSLGLFGETAEESPEIRWSYLDSTDGLHGPVHALHWSEATGHLWIGTDEEVSLIRPTFPDGSGSVLGFDKVQKLDELDRFQLSSIRQIQVSSEGDEAWILTDGRLFRLHRLTDDLVSSELFLHSAGFSIDRRYDDSSVARPLISPTADAALSPAIDGRAPRLLLRDFAGRPVVRDLADENRPRLEVAHLLFLIHVRIAVDRLTAADESDPWSARFALDRLPKAASGKMRRIIMAPDLLRFPRPHSVVARVTQAKTGRSHVVVVPIEKIDLTLWLGRIALLLFVIGTTFRRFHQRWDRRERLRRQEIPYIAGKAVEGESFFGRKSLMAKLVATVAENSYALVGPFRIGKSSIQHQLSRTLDNQDSSRYEIFPLYVDLSHMRRDPQQWDGHLFHFLGQSLFRFATGKKLDPQVLAKLDIQQTEDPTTYNSLDLLGDIRMVLQHLRARSAPRQAVILFQLDEASLMQRLSYDTLLGFRAVFVDSRNVQVVLSGTTIPPSQVGGGMSPWRNFLKEIIEVRPLSPAEARELIVEPARGLFHYEHGALNELIGLAQGQPMILQKLCANLVRYMYEEGKKRKKINQKDFEASLRWAEKEGFDLFASDIYTTKEESPASGPELAATEAKGGSDESIRGRPSGTG